MVKRILFYLFLTASLIVAVWAYFKLKESKEPKSQVTEHIPADVLCSIQTKSTQELINQLTRQNLIWNSLLTEKSIQTAHQGIKYLDSLIQSSNDLSSIIKDNNVYWSFIKDGKTLQSLIQFKLKEQSEEELVEAFFNASFKKNTIVSSLEAYDVNIYHNSWLACIDNGIVYLSSDLNVLQKSISLDKSQSLSVNESYLSLQKLIGEQNTLVYFNHKQSNLFDRTLFSQQTLFNAEVELNEITFTGYANIDKSSFFNILKNQPAENITQIEQLPQHPVSVIGIAALDATLLNNNVFANANPEVKSLNEKAWQILNDSALYNIKKESLENLAGQIAIGNYWLQEQTCMVTSLNVKDEGKTKQLLAWMSDSLISVNEYSLIKLKNEFSNIFSFINPAAANQYAILVNQSLYLLSNRLMADYFLEALKNNQLLNKDVDFMTYATDNLFSESNFIYFENCKDIRKTSYSRLINSEELNTGDEVLDKLSLTAKNFNNAVQLRINGTHAKAKSTLETNANTLWTFVSDSVISSPIYSFTNHNTQENELVFQDNANDVYLISSTGNLLWKKHISEKIKSEIFTVDIFKNGKLQLLFNTENYIHLLDRNGAYVQGFPVKLPAKVTSNITLLDYENNKDYRLFIACADKKIYNYSLYGIKTEGFLPVKTEAVVNLPIRYVRVGASDYLITADAEGKIYAFSRKGEGRIDFTNRTIQGLEHLFVLAGSSLDNTKLIYVDDKSNLLNKVSLTDKKEVLNLGDEVSGFKSSFDLLNDDAQQDVLVYGNGALYAYDLFSSKLLESFNDPAVYDDVMIVNTSNHQWLLAFDKASSKVDLITTEGKIAMSINNATKKPLVFDLYKNGKTYVVSVGFNKVSCQELN